ncbi:MAG: cytochrome P450, partial [Actinomycetota bacterium]
ETAVIDGRPRSATVTARSDLRLRIGVGSELRARCIESPDATFAFARQFATRLRDREERITPPSGSNTAGATTIASDAPEIPPAEVLVFDPTASGYFDDPNAQLDALREASPLIPRPEVDGWMVTRYADVHSLSRDRRFGHDIAPAGSSPVLDAERESIQQNPIVTLSMLRQDGDDHLRLRRLVSSAFTPRAIARWRTRTAEISAELLDALERNGGGDLIADYALPLPVRIISDMLGFDTDDAERMRVWSHQIALTLDGDISDEDRQTGNAAMEAMLERIAERYDVERAEPSDGILAALVHAEADGRRLSREEVLMNVSLLYVAGHETTTNLIGNGAVQLLRHPDELHRLRVDPSLDANVIEEIMRYDSPVQFTRRIAKEPVEVAGETLDAGTVLMLCFASANRDPRHWGPTAHRFDVGRPNANGHVSFGGGPHHCLGAALARLEGSIALPGLVRRFPRLRWTEEPAYESRVVLRGLGSLSIEV